MSPYMLSEEVEVSVTGLLELKTVNDNTTENETIDEGLQAATTEETSHGEASHFGDMSSPTRKLDKYGFITNIDSSGKVCISADTTYRVPTFAEAKRAERREKKWSVTLDSWEKRRPKQLLRRLRKGIPDSKRGKVWLKLGGGIRQPGLYQEIVKKTSDAMSDNFKELAAQSNHQAPSQDTSPTSPTSSTSASSSPAKDQKEEKPKEEAPSADEAKTGESKDYAISKAFQQVQDIIERDIHRTYPRHDLFYEEDRNKDDDAIIQSASTLLGGLCDPELASAILNLESDVQATSSGIPKRILSKATDSTRTPGGQAALRRVLRAYSYYDEDVGYCQGMNFVAGMFLTVMNEEEAFWMLVAVMHDKPCEMRGLFGEGMKETHKVLHVAERLTHRYLPKLAKHFDRENIHVTMYATQWLLTQYTSSFKFDLVMRVWDCFLGEGWKIIYRVMLALLQQWQSQLLKMSFEEILAFFRELPERVDGGVVMDAALGIRLRTKQIVKYEKEWYDRQPHARSQ